MIAAAISNKIRLRARQYCRATIVLVYKRVAEAHSAAFIGIAQTHQGADRILSLFRQNLRGRLDLGAQNQKDE